MGQRPRTEFGRPALRSGRQSSSWDGGGPAPALGLALRPVGPAHGSGAMGVQGEAVAAAWEACCPSAFTYQSRRL